MISTFVNILKRSIRKEKSLYIRNFLVNNNHTIQILKMIEGIKMLFTIIKERLILGKTWNETKIQLQENAKNNLLVKAVDPIVRRVVQNIQVIPGMVSK